MASKSGAYTPKTGPFSGQTFPSYRQYLNAKSYLRETGVLIDDRREARGAFSRATRARARERIERGGIPSDLRSEQYEYFLRGFARQQVGIAADRERRRINRRPIPTPEAVIERQRRASGSTFNRLWRAAEASGFSGEEGGAFDRLLWASGMRGGADTQAERNKYLAVIEWHIRNDDLAFEEWLDRNADGTFADGVRRGAA